MAAPVGPLIFRFKGGINSAASVYEVNGSECVDGENFDLDDTSASLRKRKPIDFVAATPNGETVRGYAQLRQADGTISTLIQAGGTVYEWDQATTFTQVGTVNSAARLRGKITHNFVLDNKVLITDLAKREVVKVWDGTDFMSLAHNLSSPLKAKYCRIHRERAWLGNVQSGEDTPHVLLGSEQSNINVLSISDRPSSSIGLDAPFFLPMPNLKPINGLEEAFGIFLMSTEEGWLYRLTGSNSFDFDLQDFHEGSNATGDEGLINIGNDVLIGQRRKIESLSGVQQFGDVQTDDVTRWIKPSLEGVGSWTFAYNSDIQKIYAVPDDRAEVWVLHKDLLLSPDRGLLSPWSKWTLNGANAREFPPRMIFSLLTQDGKEHRTYADIVVSGGTGAIHRLEGVQGGDDTDGSSFTDIDVKRITPVFRGELPEVMDVTGWISYRRLFKTVVTLKFRFEGVNIFDQDIPIQLPEGDAIPVYNGEAYYGDKSYVYNASFNARISRQNFTAAGQSSQFQIEIIQAGQVDLQIEEIGIDFREATSNIPVS